MRLTLQDFKNISKTCTIIFFDNCCNRHYKNKEKKKTQKNTHKKKNWVTILEDVRCKGSTITPTLAKMKQIKT